MLSLTFTLGSLLSTTDLAWGAWSEDTRSGMLRHVLKPNLHKI